MMRSNSFMVKQHDEVEKAPTLRGKKVTINTVRDTTQTHACNVRTFKTFKLRKQQKFGQSPMRNQTYLATLKYP